MRRHRLFKIMIRKVVVLFFCLCLLVLVAGCGKPSKEKVVIKVATFASGVDLEIWKNGVRFFEKRYPDIKVKVLAIPWGEYWIKMNVMFASNTQPDVMFANSNYFEGFVRRNVYCDLTPFIEKDKDEVNLDDFYPIMIKAFSDKGKIYALPTDICSELIFYNKDIFDKYNYPYPKDGWTWDNFLKTAIDLTKDTNRDGRIDQFGCQIELGSYINWIQQNKGKLFSDDGKECLFTSPEVIEALKFMFAPVRKGACPKYSQRGGRLDMLQGNIAIQYTGCWSVAHWRKYANFNWDVAPLPKGKVRANRTGGSGYAMCRGTKHPEEAWLLIKTLTSKEVLKTFGESGRIPPARKSVISSFVQPDKPPAHAEFAISELKYVHIPYLVPARIKNWVEAETIIISELEKVYIGSATVEEACQAIKSRVDSIIR